MAVGDYIWQDGYARSTAGQHHEELAIGSVSTNERLERVIVYWYINLVSPGSAVLGTWLDYGVQSLIQVTAGSPPPIPDQVGLEAYNLRDIVDSSFSRVGWSDVFTNYYVAPSNAPHGHHDVSIKRRPTTDPMIVWWLWGLPSFTGAGVEIGYYKVWWRVLVQQVA